MPTRNRQQWLHSTRLQGRDPEPVAPNIVFGPGGQASMVSAANPIDISSPVVPSQNTPQIQSTVVQTALTTPQSLVSDTAFSSTANGLSSVASGTSFAASSHPLSITSSATVSVSTSSISTLSPPSSTPSTSASLSKILTSLTTTSASTTSRTATTTASPNVVDATPSATSTSSSSKSKHSPPFYIGIVLGTIVIVAIISALVAWYIRLRAHARRRQEFVSQHVPWAIKRNGGEGGLEEIDSGANSEFVSAPASIGRLMRHGDGISSDVWEPRGDRDVGEPRRTESYEQSAASATRRATATANPFSEAYYAQGNSQRTFLTESTAYPLPLSNSQYPTSRPLPHHLVSTNFSVQEHHSASTLGPLQVANMMPGDVSSCDGSSRPGTAMGSSGQALTSEFGTPREPVAGLKPRFWGLDGSGLIVPWNSRQRVPENFDHRAAGGVGNWEHLPPLPMPGENQDLTSEREVDGWTSSLRSNLVNAFNAVAGNLGTSGHDVGKDRLTPIPTRSSGRHSRRAKRDGVGRPMTRESTVLTTASSAWTLEETRDGAGVVHIRGSGLESYGGGDHAWSPRPSQSAVHITNDSAATFRTYGSQDPLIAGRNPSAARIQPLRRISEAFGRSKATPTRCSSLYSTTSAESYSFRYGGRDGDSSQPPRLPSISTSSRNITTRTRSLSTGGDISRGSDTKSAIDSSRSIEARPEAVTRVSSSGCSALSYGSDLSGGTQWTHRNRQDI